MNTPIPPKVKIPTLDPYDGKTDPTDHLNTYKAQMGVQTGCEDSWCRFFPTTLKGIAQTWFNNLTPGSIRTFDMLATQFKKHFIAGSRQTKTSVHLMTVKQGENESLKDYIKRFNTESQLIPDLQDNVDFTALLFGLKSNKLKFELVHDKVSTFSKAMERAERIIEASEVCKAPVANNKGKRNQEDNYHDNRNRRPRRAESDDEGLKYNVDRREIYLDINHKAILPKPNPMNTPIEQRNKKLWCEYHKECGHTTRNCRELKRALDKLAEEGKIKRYLKSPPKDKQSKAAKEVQEAHSSADTNLSINVIAGGFASGGLSNRARKSHLRSLEEPIYDIGTPSSTPKDPLMVFGDDKGKKIQRPHDDPLVIHMKVANAKVKKILVDSGSSADIITWKYIEQMRFGRGDLTPLEKPLVGFGGHHVYPLGTIKLPIRLGEKNKGRSLVHTFLWIPLCHTT
ncbi:uncharacterized protein LOC110684934 [Chenopodium quinoa]|uniref:uncharacterized protein LOC110684934 n=1 Tax=Chenopodium quinoa TaxID=63459 RepID=UPI000B790D74|nr:uncharacterized protein LOC110684934 [Chenopodium quinoa]